MGCKGQQVQLCFRRFLTFLGDLQGFAKTHILIANFLQLTLKRRHFSLETRHVLELTACGLVGALAMLACTRASMTRARHNFRPSFRAQAALFVFAGAVTAAAVFRIGRQNLRFDATAHSRPRADPTLWCAPGQIRR